MVTNTHRTDSVSARALNGLADCMVMAIGALSAGEDPAVELYSLTPPVLKPSGQEFKFWRNETTFSKTYHVDTGAPNAADENAGTAEQPFKTISHAAGILQPGQRVVVHAGTYRECIRPARGGTSIRQMIGYYAEGQVIVKGSEPVGKNWTADKSAGVFALDLKLIDFGNYNPFALENLPPASFDIMSWAKPLRGKLPYTLPRGMVFQEAARLKRVATRAELLKTEGSHWTELTAGKLLVHTHGKKDPNGLLMEITTRRGCFRPSVRGMGFIHVHGFTFEQVDNGFPRPQEGALSVCAGHHWLIEENTVRQVNGVGIDIGNGWYGSAVKPPEEGEDAAEGNIVRRNRVEETGVCGITGIPATNALIEENVLRNNTLYPIERIYECGGIKTHKNQTFTHNFIGGAETGIMLRGKITNRTVAGKYPTTGGGHTVVNNAFYQCKENIKEHKKPEYKPNVLRSFWHSTRSTTARD